jgi:hypothetical protein
MRRCRGDARESPRLPFPFQNCGLSGWGVLRELLYSSQAPSVSLEHSLPANAFEPFHAMSRTIRSRLRELMKQQEAELDGGMDVDGTEDKATSMMKGPSSPPSFPQTPR